ncbi:MAG: TonB-dependent receptor [Verrucomicrobia bacterium]|nr:TonB-dependent receptor [Verrucomicrobiota bacterium]
MNTSNIRRAAIAVAAALLAIAGTSPAQQSSPSSTPAADQTASQQSDQLQQVTVTGYLVPRIGDGPQPVVTLDQQFIKDQGDQTVADVLQRLPQNANSFSPAVNAGQSFSPAGSDINLRGLGPNETLTLVDGHRVAPFPFPQDGTESFVDLNSYPLAAIDRIEVLKDGGSATYGSDAVAGVVNLLLKDEYEGADIFFHYGVSQRDDYSVYHLAVVSGIVDHLSDTSKFSILGAFDYYESSPILMSDRGYSSNQDHTSLGSYYNWDTIDSPYGNFIDNAGNTYSVRQGTRGPNITKNNFYPINAPLNEYGSVQDYEINPREQRYGGLIKVNYEPTSWLKFYEELTLERNKENSEIPDYGPSQTDGIVIPANNPYNPWGLPLVPIGNALLEFGPQKQVATIDSVTTISGATIQLPHNWFVDVSYVYSESDGDRTTYNQISRTGLQEALNGHLPGFMGTYYNPFVDFSAVKHPNGGFVDALRLTTDSKARTSVSTWAIKAGGDLIDLPGGTVTAGFGAEYRDDAYETSADENSKIGNIIGSGGPQSTTSARRNVQSAYAELTIPLLGNQWSFPGARLLEVVLQERYDQYSDFGSAAKPKLLVRYKPFDDLTLRATYSEGYRAPNLPELYSGSFIEQAALVDPKNPQLGTQTYFVHVQGNPELQPERSYSYYAGAVWTPGSSDPEHSWWGWANGFTAYVDWFQIAESNKIAQLDPQQVLDEENLFPGLVQRLPNGQINYVNDPFVNLGAVLVDGIDFGGSYVTKEYNWGKLNIEVDASYIYNYAVQTIKNSSANTAFGALSLTPSPIFDEEDSFDHPDLRLTGSFFYSKTVFGIDTVKTGVVLNFTDSYHDFNDNFKGTNPTAVVQPNGFVHRIGSWTTWDWQISYKFGAPEEVNAQTPAPGYSKDGKKIVGEKAISPKREGASGGIRYWLANTTLTFGINNIFDTNPPFSDEGYGFDPTTANAFGRYFYVEVEKKF